MTHKFSRTRPIGIGVIGTGMVGQMCHLAHYATMNRCKVIAVSDLRPRLAREAAQKFSVEQIYSDHHSLLADDRIEAVVVVTRRSATGPIVLDALKSGRDVLSEKPMAYTVGQASKLVAAAERSGRIYSIGYMKRHDLGVRAGKEALANLLATKSAGELISINAWCRGGDTGGVPDSFILTKEQRPEGLALWTMGPDWLPDPDRPAYDSFINVYIHIINLVRFLMGVDLKLGHVSLRTSDAWRIVFKAGSANGVFELANRISGKWSEGIQFRFEKGTLTLNLPAPFDPTAHATVAMALDGQRSELQIRDGDAWAFQRQAAAFLQDVEGRILPIASGQDALADVAFVEAIWRKRIELGTI